MPEQPSVVVNVRNVSMSIEGTIPVDLRDDIRKTMSYVIPNFKYMPCYKKSLNAGKPWDGTATVALIKGDRLEAPTGLLSYLREVLERRQIKYSVHDERLAVVPTAGYSHSIALRDYQRPVVNSILSRQRGVVKASTGSGKTQMIIAATAEAAVFPAIFYVTSCDLLEQAYDRCRQYLLFNGGQVDVGRIGAGHCDIRPITIATVQSCERAISGEYNKYDFDDFSADDETEFSEKQKSDIKSLVSEAQFVYVDECLRFDSKVSMPDGTKRNISSLVNQKYSGNVMSWNVSKKKFEPKQVIGWIRKKPDRPILRVGLGNTGGITCTDNHVFYTSRGEVEAKDIRKGDAIVSFSWDKDRRVVPAISEEAKQVLYGSIGDGYLSIPTPKANNARLVITHCLKQEEYLKYKMSFFAPLQTKIRPAKSGYTGKGEIQGVTACSPDIKAVYDMTEKERVTRMNWLGLSILFLDDGSLDQRQGSGTISCMDHDESVRKAIIDKFAEYGIIAGEFLTAKGWVIYIPRVGMEKFGRHLAKYAPACLRYKVPNRYRSGSLLHKPGNGRCFGWLTVRSVSASKMPSYGKTKNKLVNDVYCLKVAGNHNFIANGCVVHNCHHVSCKTIQTILNNSHRARFRIGGSASPWRDDGLDILIEACFGRRLCDIDASSLIERGFLIRPTIVFNHFCQKLGPAETFNAHYKKYVVENAARNNWIADRTIKYCEENKPTIILVKWVSHAEELAKLIPGAEILAASGKSGKNSDKRKKILDRMRNRELKCVIGTSLLDEGVDVPAATVGIFAGGGKSSTRELQRIGRFIRKDEDFPEKDSARIEDFFDHTKWLMHHAKSRRRILDTERAFDILDNRDTMSL